MDCSPPGSSVHGDSLAKNTGVGCHALLQGIFPTQGSNPGLLYCRKNFFTIWATREACVCIVLCKWWTSVIAQLVKNLPAMQETRVWYLVKEISWRRDRLSVPVFLGFPCDSVSKESTCNTGDLGLIPGLGRSPGGGHGNPLQYSCLQNPHGQRSLVGYSSRGHKELDMTERLSTAQQA